MKYYQSKAGEVMSEKEWRDWVDSFWSYSTQSDKRCPVVKPSDSWERAVRVLDLREVCGYN